MTLDAVVMVPSASSMSRVSDEAVLKKIIVIRHTIGYHFFYIHPIASKLYVGLRKVGMHVQNRCDFRSVCQNNMLSKIGNIQKMICVY